MSQKGFIHFTFLFIMSACGANLPLSFILLFCWGGGGEGVIHDVQLEKNLHKNNQDVFNLTDTSKVQ